MHGVKIRELMSGRRGLWTRIAVAAVLVVAVMLIRLPGRAEKVTSYNSCADAGYLITDSNPPVCHGPGKSYAGPVRATATPLPAQKIQGFNLLVNGDTGNSYPKRQVVITSQSEWQQYWRDVHQGMPDLPPILNIDFATNDVVAITNGPTPTSGFNVRVTAILVGETGSTIDVVEQVPTVTCAVAQVVSNRYFIATTPKLPQPVNFRVTTDYRHC